MPAAVGALLPHTVHLAFDMLAVVLAAVGGFMAYRWRFQAALEKTAADVGQGYFYVLSFGSIAGAYFFGTLNLYLTGIHEAGRSILGAIVGATIMVELYKKAKGIRQSTGYLYIIPFCILIIIGRLGCLLSGLNDHTYGTETSLPWGWDYGDDILRHPVQVYEGVSMLLFLAVFIAGLKFHQGFIIRFGYYFGVGFYAFQRFFWEFLKPYSDVAGPLNLFQILCIGLVLYSIFMIKGRNVIRAA